MYTSLGEILNLEILIIGAGFFEIYGGYILAKGLIRDPRLILNSAYESGVSFGGNYNYERVINAIHEKAETIRGLIALVIGFLAATIGNLLIATGLAVGKLSFGTLLIQICAVIFSLLTYRLFWLIFENRFKNREVVKVVIRMSSAPNTVDGHIDNMLVAGARGRSDFPEDLTNKRLTYNYFIKVYGQRVKAHIGYLLRDENKGKEN